MMIQESPLNDIASARGACFEAYHGWRVAGRFSSLEVEYQLARRRAALCDLSHRPKLRITGGASGVEFLHSITTNDLKALRPGQGLTTLLLTTHGKLVAELRVFRSEQDLWLDCEPLCFEAALEVLSKYRLSTQFDLMVERDTASLGLLGPGARTLLSSMAPGSFPLHSNLDHAVLRLGDTEARTIFASSHGATGFEIWGPKDSISRVVAQLENRASPEALGWIGWSTINILRLEAGIPRFGIDMDSTHLPQEVLLESSVSYTKGCFVGQETMARLKYRGHVNKTLVGLRFATTDVPEPGSRILGAGNEVGKVTSAGRSPGLAATIGLGFVRGEFQNPGQELTTVTSSGSISTDVAQLPFHTHRINSHTA